MFGRRVCQVELDALHQGAKGRHCFALATLGHASQHIGRELQVPGVIEFAGFHHRTASGCGVATALERECGKGWLGRVSVVGVGDHLNHVVGAEILHHERPSAHRVEVLLGAGWSLVTQAVFELRFLNDGRCGAAKYVVGVGLGRLEGDAHRVVVQCYHFVNRREGAGLGAAFDVSAVLKGEQHVLYVEGGAVRPFQAFFELVGDGFEVGRKAAVGNRGHIFGQCGNHLAFFIELDQWVEHQ